MNYLDAITHNKYARNPDKLRAWESANHIERAPAAGEEIHAACPINVARVLKTFNDPPTQAETQAFADQVESLRAALIRCESRR